MIKISQIACLSQSTYLAITETLGRERLSQPLTQEDIQTVTIF